MPTDPELLRRYVEQGDQRAFADIVHGHLPLVYAAALRRTGGRTALAEEIAQNVFCDLARKASALRHHPALTGWLYRSTRYAAVDAIRAEARRQKMAQSLITMSSANTPAEPGPGWDKLRPMIDRAMDRLKDRDREIMLLRFFSELSFAEVGARLNLTENAARMRADRALDRLRLQLTKDGVTSSSAALGLMLGSEALASAPTGLAATITTAATAMPPMTGIAGLTSIFLMSKLTIPILSAALAAALTSVVWNSVTHDVSAQELAALRQENARLTRMTASGAGTAYAVVAAGIARAVDQRHAKSAVNSAATMRTATSTQSTGNDGQPSTNSGQHRDHGQATPHDAFMSFAWAADAADVGALSKLIYFDDNSREKALAVLATMPESIQAQYSTPEELYAFLFAADTIGFPPPADDVLESAEAVELTPGRVVMQPGGQQYQLTPDGWKYVLPEAGVENAPKVLNNQTLAKLGTP